MDYVLEIAKWFLNRWQVTILRPLWKQPTGIFRGGGSADSTPPPEIFRFFLKSEGKEVERERGKK